MEKVRLGIIGCGGFARWHMQNLIAIPEVQITALADPDPVQIRTSRDRFADLQHAADFVDYRELLAQADVDAVLIATPHTQHLSQIEDSFRAGKHVIVDKPLCTSVADVHAAIKARDASGKVGLLSYQRHTSAEYCLIRQRIQEGAIGTLQHASIFLCQEWLKFTVGSWRQDPALSGGGMLLDSGSHMLDALLWCTGLQPETVVAFTENRSTPVEINSAAAIRFRGGALGTITVCGDAPGWQEEFTLWGDKGMISLRQGKITFTEQNGSRFLAEEVRGGSNPDQNFIDCVRGRAENQSPFEAGLAVMGLTEAVYRSAANGGAPYTVA